MKLLTRLRELRNENTIDSLFDNFHFSVALSQSELTHSDEVMGIGATTYDDIPTYNDINSVVVELNATLP